MFFRNNYTKFGRERFIYCLVMTSSIVSSIADIGNQLCFGPDAEWLCSGHLIDLKFCTVITLRKTIKFGWLQENTIVFSWIMMSSIVKFVVQCAKILIGVILLPMRGRNLMKNSHSLLNHQSIKLFLPHSFWISKMLFFVFFFIRKSAGHLVTKIW